MPQVPVYQQTESLRPNLRQGIDVQANPDDFGAAVGRGLSNVAQGLGNFSDAVAAVRSKENETRAKDADNSLADATRKALYDPDTGFMFQEGKNAVDGFKGFQSRVEELRKEYGKGLTGEAAQMYNQAANSRVDGAIQTGMIHTGSAKKEWFKNASESRINTFQQDAIAAYGNPDEVNKNLRAGVIELRNRAADEGWDNDTLKNKALDFVSTTRRNVLMRIANDDPIEAEKYFNEHKDQFTGQDQYAITGALKEGLIVEKSKREADRIISGGGSSSVQGVAGPRIVAGGDLTVDLIRGKEGFRSSPYWDVNHYRVGFGSDTITRADGTVVKTRPGMSISRADAERDLNRRVQITQGEIQSQIGGETWRSLTPQAQAAMTSVAYNYGTLPGGVVSAARSGDPTQIATAIRGLGSDNGGVNRNRRNHEADIAAGTAGVSSAGGLSYTSMEEQLSQIKDPDVRDATRKRLNSMMEAQSKAQSAQQKQAEMQVFSTVEQGGTPDDVPLEVRLAAGQASMSSAWNYHEAKIKRGEPETDQTLLYELRKQAATDPNGFADKNLMEYRDRLDNTAFKELTDKQTSSLSDSVKAVQTGSVYADAYKQSEAALEGVGLSTVGTKDSDRQEMAARIAKFQNTLHAKIDEFRQANNDRVPNYAETQQMINQLLLPVVIQQEKSMWNPTKTPWSQFTGKDAFAFEARYRPDGTRVEVKVDYTDIPIELRTGIARDLETDLGRKPTPDEIVQRYEQFVLGQ